MANNPSFGNILMVDDVIVHLDVVTEYFCCDLEACKGRCCIEGDAGAPVTMEEVAEIENVLDTVWPQLSASAQAEIDKNGVSYVDEEGDLVTSIVNGKDCVFTCYRDLPLSDGRTAHNCCLCALESAFRAGKTHWPKPISCYLYPIREKKLGSLVGLNYHRWDVCREAVELGTRLKMPVYKFLRDPLIRRFGAEWYARLEETVEEMRRQGVLPDNSL